MNLRYEITEQGTDYVALSLVYEARLLTWLTAVDAENHHATFYTCLYFNALAMQSPILKTAKQQRINNKSNKTRTTILSKSNSGTTRGN